MMSAIIPIPRISIAIRDATMADIPFIDALQKIHKPQVGFMYTETLEGKIALGHVIVAEDEAKRPVGYCIGNDKYLKREELGVIFQMNVMPDKQRGLIGASLVKAMFDRAAPGCKLFCLWCAQEIAANCFWEAMGFIPIAFRAGGRTKKRIHIFWQKRIRAGDTGGGATPYWYPSETGGGAIGEDRLVFPIPPGVHWSADMPRILPGQNAPLLDAPAPRPARERKPKPAAPIARSSVQVLTPVRFASERDTTPQPKPKREKRPKAKNDPALRAATRQLRDVWQEKVSSGEYLLPEPAGKYEVCRQIESMPARQMPMLPSVAA